MHISLPEFSNASLLVVGDVMLDRYWHGPTERISPEAPVPVMRVTGDEMRPGGAGNVALNAAALGAETTLIGLVGEDREAEMLRQRLMAEGVACAFRALPGQRTITKLRIVSKNQQLLRLDFEPESGLSDAGYLGVAYTNALTGRSCVLLSDYAKGALRQVQDFIGLARARGIPVIVDPKGLDFQRYRGATLLTPNQAEFEAVAGRAASEEDLLARADRLRADLNLSALLITRGERGMTLIEADRPPLHLPTQAREVFDVTGAGDTVVATLGVALAAGMALHDAVHLANLAAGIVVGKFGTATVSRAELAAAMEAHLPLRLGVIDEDGLLPLLARARASGERIVMTNGCFDILHPGHVAYLKQARALGDRLIVAVNDDASVSRLKGPQRPVNPLAARMQLLEALAAVDWVVPFSEDTPERLICRLTPDTLVKGGDYRVDEIAGADCVRRAGGEVRVLPFVDGYSTSALIASISAATQNK
jgi:D-beta-D-heptose 7-phosphate kinase/D-beta-D-heptose 1-phosphate adenosyltransferase